MKTGFTLLEIVVSLLLLEATVLAAVGTLVVASRTLTEAEQVGRAVVEAEGVLDSLGRVDAPTDGSRAWALGTVDWTTEGPGTWRMHVGGRGGESWLDLVTGAPVP